MGFFFKTFLFLIISFSYLQGDTHSFSIDNDAFASNKDAHYTGGLFYTWMDDSNKTNSKAISVTYLAFTPVDKKESKEILNDLPYAGYVNLNFLFYKKTKNSFHEFGLNIGMVGSSTKSDEIQSVVHKVIGANKPKGWNNQLDDQLMVGASYNFAKKTNSIDIGYFQFDWTNNIRFDVGNFYSGALASTSFRVGSNLQNTFSTTGNFIGGDESSLLNFKKINGFDWAISLGFFANKINNYYIVDEAITKGYTISKLSYITGEQVAYDIFYNNIKCTFKIKSVYLYNNKLFSGATKQWGGFSVMWKF